MRVADLGRSRRDYEIAAQHQFEAAGERQSVEGRNHRGREVFDPVHDSQHCLQEIVQAGGVRLRFAADIFEVCAGTERPPGPGQHDRMRAL